MVAMNSILPGTLMMLYRSITESQTESLSHNNVCVCVCARARVCVCVLPLSEKKSNWDIWLKVN